MNMDMALVGIMSQSSEPAKVLADDYIAFINAQSGTKDYDYQTIYNIYKNEYLTDPEKDKIKIWFDARAAHRRRTGFENDYTHTWSLIYPYEIASYASPTETFKIVNNRMLVAQSATPRLGFNPKSLIQDVMNLRIEYKIDYVANGVSDIPLTYMYGLNQTDIVSLLSYVRYLSTTKRLRVYLTHFDDTTNGNFPTNAYLEDVPEMIIKLTIDYVNMRTIFQRNELSATVAIAAGKTNKILQDTARGFVMYVYDVMPRYWEKYYKL